MADTVKVVPPMHMPWRFPADATYVIAGGLGGIGRSIARWMSKRGATHLVLLGRNGASTTAASELITELKRMGTKVAAPACDISVASSLKDVLEKIDTFPPIKGCVQAAMVLQVSSLLL